MTTRIPVAAWTEPDGATYQLTVMLELRDRDSSGVTFAERGMKTIDLEPAPPGVLDFTGTCDITRNGRDYSGGALVEGDPIPADVTVTWASGWSRDRWDRLVAFIDRWHLNCMRSGCRHQRDAKWGERPIDPARPLRSYGRHFNGQTQDTWNMLTWIRPGEHPDGLLTKPCDECGYPFGSAWLVEPLSPEALTYLDGLGVKPPEKVS